MATKVGKKKSSFKYIPVYHQAPLDDRYHYYDENGVLKINDGLFTLCTSVEQLKEFAKTCEGKEIGFDTETTGLTFFEDFIVGFSVSVDEYSGIYVPIRHQIRRVDKVKEKRRDENGEVILTKRGLPSMHTIEKCTYFESPYNLPAKECLDILYHDIMMKAKLNVLHNSEFDLTMLKAEGYDITKLATFDTMILTYLFDAENKNWNKLKEATNIVLGRKPMKFYEALGAEDNFRYVDLNVGYTYAASDSANTIGIYKRLKPLVKELLKKAPYVVSMEDNGVPYNVFARDNELIRAFTDYYSHVNLRVDRQAAIKYKNKVEDDLAEVEASIFGYFKKGSFNLQTGSKDFKETMLENNFYTGVLTDKGQPSYGKKGIEKLSRSLRKFKELILKFKSIPYVEKTGNLDKRGKGGPDALALGNFLIDFGKDQFKIVNGVNTFNIRSIEGIKLTKPEFFEEVKLCYRRTLGKLEILKLIQKRSSLTKALGSYIAKLTEVDTCHMRYRLSGTASGRLSSGNGSKTDKKKNHYFIDLNAQNLTKPHSAYYKAERSDEEGNILGWKFTLVTEEYMHEHKDEELIVEGSNPENNIRNCLIAPEGRYILSLDYSAQEYLVLAILSGDRHMISNFVNGIDPHTATAYAVWGKENYDRQKRKKAKGCNFLMNYCGGARTLAENLDIPLEEAEDIIKKYEEGFPECIEWKKREMENTIRNQDGVAYTIFGRPRQFKTLMSHSVNLTDTAYAEKVALREGIEVKEVKRRGQAIEEAVKRKIVSHAIQGTCGDICRWDLIRLYRRYFKERDPHVDFYSTVHDEINFAVDKDYVIQYAREIDDIMTITNLNKQLPIKTSIDIGYTLGVLFPFEWEDESRTNLVPQRC